MTARTKRMNKLEKSMNGTQNWPEITFISWNDGRGPFAAFIPGQSASLSREMGHGDSQAAETVEEFTAKAKARYAEIKAQCAVNGSSPDPSDPLKDLLDGVARNGRTILDGK